MKNIGIIKENFDLAHKLIKLFNAKQLNVVELPLYNSVQIESLVLSAAKEIEINVPLVVRLAGTKFEEGKKILDNSGLKIISATDLSDAAKKVVEAIK